jgi:hypothetical protein
VAHASWTFAANSGAAIRDLIYQHEARGADQRITDAIDSHVQAGREDQGDDDGPAGVLVPAG